MTDAAPSSQPSPAPRNTRRLVVVGTTVAVLVVAGSAAFAWQKLSGNGTQPHDVLPSSVIAYARVDGDPSASQKVKLLRLLKKSPALAEELDLKDENQDLRMPIIESMLSDCDINYDKDIAPWIGNRFGAGLASNGKTGLLAVQVTDEKAARKGLDLAAGCLGISDPGVVFIKGYALLGEGQDATEKAAKDADKSPLADKKEFVEDMEDLGDPGIVSIWVEAKGLGKAFASEMGDAAGQQALKDVRSAAAALRAGDDNVEITGISHANKDTGKVTAVDFGKLPAESLVAASVSVGEDNFDNLWAGLSDGMDAMGSSSNHDPSINHDDFLSTLKEIEDQTGFVLPDDIKTLLGDNLTIVAGDRNLSTIDQFQGPADVKKFDVAVAMHSDTEKATALAHKIADVVAKFTGIELAVVETKDGAVLATNEKFARSFNDGKPLGDNDSFKSVISESDNVVGAFYFDIAKAIKVAREQDPPDEVKDGIDQVKDMRALGFSANKESDRVTRGTLKLSFRQD